MDTKEIINAIFNRLIDAAEEDSMTTTFIAYLEDERQFWLEQNREVN